ncbi:hypothetical protein KUCAC02_003740 [Chaenocephalus aceratus]|uniref:Uncharacterized protein n=1 Tax=Chaenocephalus aceratus TaxID=36190 RepID=A0ACB9WLP9_CHAAC|nr:hypothetical protein KUCAC02_003740 [Chaenocephalus aceratus]
MILTQESVLSLLIAEGGQVKKSDLVGKFKDSINCEDSAEKEQNKELFKTFVNNVAFVKEIDGVRYVIVRKTYQHFLNVAQTEQIRVEKSENKEIPQTGEQQRPHVQGEETGGSEEAAGGEISAVSEPDQEDKSELSDNPTKILYSIQQALQRSTFTSVRVKRVLNFEIQKQETNEDSRGSRVNEPTRIQSKPYALPLRMPPSTTMVQIRKLKLDPDDLPNSPKLDSFRNKRSSAETDNSISSPQLRRVSEEHQGVRGSGDKGPLSVSLGAS